MEIADEVSLFELTADRLRRAPDGRVRFQVDRRVSYEIPPQSAEDRTLAYQLGSRAYGIAGGRGVDIVNLESCVAAVMATADDPAVETNRAEIFAVDYGDTVQSFSEATDKLVANEVHVAGDKSQAVRDFTEARHAVWNDHENSIRAAAAALARADGDVDADALVLPICLRPADGDSVQGAIDFLRAEPVPPILDQAAPDLDVIDAVQDAFAEDFPDLYPGGEPPADFLARFNLTEADIAGARRYLQDEHVVFDRTMLETTPGSGRIAGLASPPAPLPAAAALVKTAGSRALPSTDVTDPAYRASGALQTLDYLRWGARKALRRAAGLPATIRPVLSMAAAIGETESGHGRIEVTAGSGPAIDLDEVPVPPTSMTVRLHGVGEADEFMLVRSADGLRCVLLGNVEGAPCDPDDYLLATGGTFEAGDNYDQQMDGTRTFSIAPVQEQVFVVAHNSPFEVVGGFDGAAAARADGGLLAPFGGQIQEDLLHLVAPDPFQCGRPAQACAGLPADLVVPLESEITEDDDPYENSWKHYLDLADQMSREADALGEELIRAGLELDQRGEAARDELEAICGGVLNVPDIFAGQDLPGGGEPEDIALVSPDASLATCLPDQAGTTVVPWSTLGTDRVCAWREDVIGAPCVCSPVTFDDLCRDDAGTEQPCICTMACPQPIPRSGDCAEVWALPNPVLPPGFSLVPAADEDLRVLGLLPSSQIVGVNCGLLAELRTGVGADGVRLGAEERARHLRDLRRQGWLNFRTLHSLVSSSSYDEDFRDDLEVSVGGSAIISTRDDALPPCAEPLQSAALESASSLFGDPDLPLACGAGDTRRTATRTYIARARRSFGTLGLLSGALDQTMTRSWAAPGASECAPIVGSSLINACGAVDNPFDAQIPFFACQFAEQGCKCLRAADPDDPDPGYGNVECSEGARFDHTVILGLRPDAAEAINRLWGVGDDVNGCAEDTGPTSVFDVLCRRPVGAHLSTVSPGEQAADRFSWFDMFDFSHATLAIFDEPEDLLTTQSYNNGQRHADALSVTDEDVYDALALACYMALELEGGCPPFDPGRPLEVPTVRTVADLRKVERFLTCAADSIRLSSGRTLLANIPEVVTNAVGRGQLLTLYPGYRGEHLEALVAVQTDIEQLASLASAIQDQLRRAAVATSATRQQLQIDEVQAEIVQLQSMAQLLSTVTNSLAGAIGSFGLSTIDLVPQMMISEQVAALQGEFADLRHGQVLIDYVGQAGDILSEMTRLGSDLRETILRLNADVSRIEALETRALSAAARAAFGDSDASGHLFPVTSVMRRRYNTLRIRYERARDRARMMAFIARRAIEQRFGADLTQMNDDLTLVDAPATWAEDLCSFEGIDYARIRQKQVDEGAAEDDRVPENFVDGYLGEYVMKLRLFVETYPFDFPFQDGGDLAVISLRDDVYRTRAECEVEVANLLASSEAIPSQPDLDEAPVWVTEGCEDSDADGITEPCLELQTQPGVLVAQRSANRVADAPLESGVLTGSVRQDIEILEGPVTLLLSWREGFLPPDGDLIDDLGVAAPAPYRVTLERLGADPPEVTSFEGEPEDLGGQRSLKLAILQAGTVRITIDPSASDVPGDVWLAELQLEVLDFDRALLDFPPPSAYMPTTRSGISVQAVCPDFDGSSMRERFLERRCESICPAGIGRDCNDEDAIGSACFFESSFGLGLEQIERGELIPSAQIALGNYNYRHDLVAVNLVGTNVRDCSESEEPATCYSNAFIPFTLVHEGDDIPIRNHDGETVPFDFERAFIEHGKALASEVVLTNPVTGSAETLLGSYYKQELRGRPLMGHYTLRIWDDPALNWDNVEDVQLVFRYRYWTRFER
jgi:hypothetical protein